MKSSSSQYDKRAVATKPGSRRLLALDTYRGAVIMAMVFVNTPGDAYERYKFLVHAVWDGWTFADLIAPAFLWIIGFSMVISLQRRMEEERSLFTIFVHIFRRAFIIFLLGFMLNVFDLFGSSGQWSVIKYMGVLQRIGVSYLIAAAIYVIAGVRGHIVWVFAGPIVYLLLLNLIPVWELGAKLSLEGDAGAYLDQLVLGQHGGHPHTLLSILTSTSTISFGILTGCLLQKVNSDHKKTWVMLVVGTGLIVLGEIAGQWLPVNRRLWTLSFVLLTAGITTVSFCFFFWLIEVMHSRTWTKPFVVFGLNPIVIFFLSELGRILANKKGVLLEGGQWISLWDYIYRILFLRIADPINASLLFSGFIVLIFLIFAYVLHQKGWIVKV